MAKAIDAITPNGSRIKVDVDRFTEASAFYEKKYGAPLKKAAGIDAEAKFEKNNPGVADFTGDFATDDEAQRAKNTAMQNVQRSIGRGVEAADPARTGRLLLNVAGNATAGIPGAAAVGQLVDIGLGAFGKKVDDFGTTKERPTLPDEMRADVQRTKDAWNGPSGAYADLALERGKAALTAPLAPIATGAKLVTPEGREELRRRPLEAAMTVAPAVLPALGGLRRLAPAARGAAAAPNAGGLVTSPLRRAGNAALAAVDDASLPPRAPPAPEPELYREPLSSRLAQSTVVDKVARAAGASIGGALGGTAGTALGGPVGTGLGTVAGAAAGERTTAAIMQRVRARAARRPAAQAPASVLPPDPVPVAPPDPSDFAATQRASAGLRELDLEAPPRVVLEPEVLPALPPGRLPRLLPAGPTLAPPSSRVQRLLPPARLEADAPAAAAAPSRTTPFAQRLPRERGVPDEVTEAFEPADAPPKWMTPAEPPATSTGGGGGRGRWFDRLTKATKSPRNWVGLAPADMADPNFPWSYQALKRNAVKPSQKLPEWNEPGFDELHTPTVDRVKALDDNYGFAGVPTWSELHRSGNPARISTGKLTMERQRAQGGPNPGYDVERMRAALAERGLLEGDAAKPQSPQMAAATSEPPGIIPPARETEAGLPRPVPPRKNALELALEQRRRALAAATRGSTSRVEELVAELARRMPDAPPAQLEQFRAMATQLPPEKAEAFLRDWLRYVPPPPSTLPPRPKK
jgi:hypothetical protein